MMTYILIGIVFMFCVEYSLNIKSVKIHLKNLPEIGWRERIIGIIIWPLWLGVFFKNFFKEFFK